MSYDRAARFAGATQFSVVQVDLTWFIPKLKSISGACNLYGISATIELPTLTTPAQLILDLSAIESVSPYDLSVIGRAHNLLLGTTIDAAVWNLKDRQVVINLEVNLGEIGTALTYNIATALPA